MITDFPLSAAVLLFALALDQCLGEPRRWHPLVGFGRMAATCEARLNRGGDRARYFLGMFSWTLAVLPPTVALFAVDRAIADTMWLRAALSTVVIYLAVGWRSMTDHVAPIQQGLVSGDLDSARQHLSYVVSRDTSALDETAIAAAAVETTLENSSDALFATLFWYVLLGPAGVVLHRLSNTLDAMWGYRTARFDYFGAFAARVDDGLNLLPGQLVALSFAIVSRSKAALRCHFRQGWRWKSLSAGPVMASGAAALGLKLGGSASYHGVTTIRAALGEGRAPQSVDISKAVSLVNRTLLLWLGLYLTALLLMAWGNVR